MKNRFNNDIYKMYEEAENKIKLITKEYKKIKLDYDVLKKDYINLKNGFENKIIVEVEKATIPLNNKIDEQSKIISNAFAEIERLKSQLEEKEYKVDKLECQINKDSTNSGIPTSKEINNKHVKTRTNTYNHRNKSFKRPGGQFGHKGSTLTKEKLLTKIKDNNIKVKEIIHYINGDSKKDDIEKYRIGINVELYVEKHIFKHTKKSKEKLPKEYYSDVTYNEEIEALVVTLGNYYSLGYSKVNEILNDFSNGVINISEGTIDNMYEDFSNKSLDTINNIITNILNSTYQHTDEITTSENGKDSYYRGYANLTNVLYKYHHHKGDTPIEEDNILNNFFGTVISDHEVGIFKYGTNNQDCIIHIGRYCIEGNQNVIETGWQMKLYEFLLRCDRTRKIAKCYGLKSFDEIDLKALEKEYDDILNEGKIQNENISSSYWKEKEVALMNRLVKYKNCVLFYLHDFSIPPDNNFMERCLRMIKGKTKVSGGFRSTKGGERFGNIMSIIKTAKLRNMNPFDCVKQICQGKVLFA